MILCVWLRQMARDSTVYCRREGFVRSAFSQSTRGLTAFQLPLPFHAAFSCTIVGRLANWSPPPDWLERFKPYIQDGKTIVVAPHRVFGPDTNDLVLQLRKRKISKVILGGMLANMCVESHLRELLERGFEVAVAKDATAAPKHPEWGYGYEAALINYAFLAHAVLTTDQAVKAMEHGQP
jgi:Isochorismatase family